jgi:pimeloyl-ACP methyl ester carboxylesterase
VKLGAEEVTASRRSLSAPGIVVTSRVGRWLELETPDLWRPFSLEALDNRWQSWHKTLAADLGATQKVADVGGHYVQNDQPELVAGAIDEVVRLAARARL